MTASIAHRGPDGTDTWLDRETGVGLGHRRLAILDLSDAGQQPMTSASGRFVLTYNGEIYNHMELRAALGARAPNWRGHSDTESLLGGFDAWGVEATVQRAVGMFAFAVWDCKERVLWLGRDRFGEKPLYWSDTSGGVVFGSEMKALSPFPGVSREIDPDAVRVYMQASAIGAPRTIFRGVRKVPPGNVLSISGDHAGSTRVTEHRYWDVRESIAAPRYTGSAETAVERLDEMLTRAVGDQMISDAPLGAFLSGGIDSGLIVARMAALGHGAVRTFSVGFEDAAWDESERAQYVAGRVLAKHTNLFITERDACESIPEILRVWDEPLADNSQIPTLMVSRLAREHVKVALTGDGGDELFGGYTRYRSFAGLERAPFKTAARRAADPMASAAARLSDCRAAGLRRVGQRLAILSEAVRGETPGERYARLLFQPRQVAKLLASGDSALAFSQIVMGRDALETASVIDVLTYLPDQVLTKVDRASMSTGLETRAPFLDHRLAEFALRLPTAIRVRSGQAKWPLQVLFRRALPEFRPGSKRGFGVPMAEWLRGRLRPWAGDVLLQSAGSDYFDQDTVERLWEGHLARRVDASLLLWRVIAFKSWYASFA